MSLIARTTLLLLGTAAFLLNPAACATDDAGAEYQYGDAEMRAAVEGIWKVTVGHPTGAATVYSFRLAQAYGTPTASRGGLLRQAMACGSRTLVRSASACVDVTTMPLTGQVIEGDERAKTSTVKGEMMVAGLSFAQAQLTVEIGSRKLFGQISSDGKVTSLGGDLLDGGTAVMMRIAP
jgi:hypothetical protein